MPVYPSRLNALLTALPLSLLLGGCIENLPEVAVGKGDVRNAIAKGSIGSPRGATIAMASLEGGSPAVEARFRQAFAKQAADREITMADPLTAHYLVRGYLSAYPSESGTDLAYVYDIFDANSQRRIDRVDDTLTVPGSNPDAWALVDDRLMESLAGRSADSLAVMLAGTPEAQAGSAPVSTAQAGSSAGADPKPN